MKKIIAILIFLFVLGACAFPTLAHSGKTDSNGGHTDSSTGQYHYHCGGHPAHQHYGGVCPYADTPSYQKPGGESGSSSSTTPPPASEDDEGIGGEILICVLVIAGVWILKVWAEKKL